MKKVIVLILIILFGGVAFYCYQYPFNPKYTSAQFKSYKRARLHCDQFFGGTHETDAELYDDMKINHGTVGC